jgi:hypothetical protein
VQRYVTPFRVASERVHKYHFISFRNLKLQTVNGTGTDDAAAVLNQAGDVAGVGKGTLTTHYRVNNFVCAPWNHWTPGRCNYERVITLASVNRMSLYPSFLNNFVCAP